MPILKNMNLNENIDKTYFLTGATGFLGGHLVRALLRLNHRVFCLRRKTSINIRIKDIEEDICWVELESLNPMAFFKENVIHGVIHCATDYGRKIVDPLQTIEANLVLPLRLLHAAASNGTPVFINTDTILDKLINNYSLSKHQFSEWLQSYSEKIRGINIALEHFYGAGDDITKFTTFVIKSLILKKDILALTKGDQMRDFIFIDDAVAAILLLLKSAEFFDYGYYRFEIGTGKQITIREFCDLAKSLSGNVSTLLDYGALPYRKNEIMRTKIDNSGILKLGWTPTVDLEEGLRRTIAIEAIKVGICDI